MILQMDSISIRNLLIFNLLTNPIYSQRGSNNNKKAEDMFILTIGGERSKDVYAFEPDSFVDIRVPEVHIARKAGAAAFYDNKLVCCGGISEEVRNRRDLDSCEVYEQGLIKQEEPEIPPLPHPLQYFTMIVYRKQLLAIGGTWKEEVILSNTTEPISDSENPEVETLTTTSTPLITTTPKPEYIRKRSKDILRYTPEYGWETFLQLEIPRSSHACEIIFPDSTLFVDITKEPTQDLYCFGGLTENGRTNSLEIYEQNAERWFNGPNMSIARSAFASTSFKSKIYVSGGKNDQAEVENTVDIYDIRRRQWTLFENEMTVRRYYHTSFYADGYLFIRGGSNKQDSESARKTLEIVQVDKITGLLQDSNKEPSNFIQYDTEKYEGKSLHSSVMVDRSWLPDLDPDMQDWEPEATPRYSGIDEDNEFDFVNQGLEIPTPSTENSDLAVHSFIGNSLLQRLQERGRKQVISPTESQTPTNSILDSIEEIDSENNSTDTSGLDDENQLLNILTTESTNSTLTENKLNTELQELSQENTNSTSLMEESNLTEFDNNENNSTISDSDFNSSSKSIIFSSLVMILLQILL